MNKTLGAAYAALFILSVLLTPILIYAINKYLFYFYLISLLTSASKSAFGFNNKLTSYAFKVTISVDQHWGVLMAPLLNLGVTTKHKFGKPDETVSSVVGKNLQETNLLRWRIIEKFLSYTLSAGRPHAIPSIERDE